MQNLKPPMIFALLPRAIHWIETQPPPSRIILSLLTVSVCCKSQLLVAKSTHALKVLVPAFSIQYFLYSLLERHHRDIRCLKDHTIFIISIRMKQPFRPHNLPTHDSVFNLVEVKRRSRLASKSTIIAKMQET